MVRLTENPVATVFMVMGDAACDQFLPPPPSLISLPLFPTRTVVGPPTLALLAMSKSAFAKPSHLPASSVNDKWHATCTQEKKNSAGAVDIISAMLPAAPTTL